jgi:membrane associated rhomboid family serine protease
LLLVAGNLFAAFAVLLNPELVREFGFNAKDPAPRDYVTSLLLHQNVFHLLGNMLFLAAVGAIVEINTGWIRYALVYFLSGFTGLVLHYFMLRSVPGESVFIGASGCVAGCIGYYALRYQAIRVPVVPRIALPIMFLTFAWLGLQVLGALIKVGEGGGTAYWAHLGGFGMGVALSAIFRTPDFGQLMVARQTLDQMSIRGPSALKIAAERHVSRYPEDHSGWLELAKACQGLGDHDGESSALLKVLSLQTEPDINSVKRLAEIGRVNRLSIVERARYADLASHLDHDLADILYQSVLDSSDASSVPDAVLAYLGFAREHRAGLARNLRARLEEEFPLSTATEVARKRGWLP